MLLPDGAPFLPPPQAMTMYSRPLMRIDRRRRVAGRRQRRLPQQLARELVVGVELVVEVRRADEQQPAGGDDRAAVVVAAGVLQPLRGELRDIRRTESSSGSCRR